MSGGNAYVLDVIVVVSYRNGSAQRGIIDLFPQLLLHIGVQGELGEQPREGTRGGVAPCDQKVNDHVPEVDIVLYDLTVGHIHPSPKPCGIP